jgi:hypothetical protein
MGSISDLLDLVVDEPSFLRFASALHEERIAVEDSASSMDGFQGPWANGTIAGFLEAAIAWSDDSGFGARPGPKPDNPWRLFASFLWAGRSYE